VEVTGSQVSSPVVDEEVAGVQREAFGAGPRQGDGTREVRGPLEVLDLEGQAVLWEGGGGGGHHTGGNNHQQGAALHRY